MLCRLNNLPLTHKLRVKNRTHPVFYAMNSEFYLANYTENREAFFPETPDF